VCYALATFASLPLSKHTGELLLLPSPAGLFIHSSNGDCSPSILWSSGCSTLFAKCLFCFFSYLFIIRIVFFPLFSLGGGQSVQGAMLIYCVPLSSPGDLHLLKQSGSWHLVVWELCLGWGCGGVSVLPLLGGFSCQAYPQYPSKILL
jgi:hypothetical protein